MKIDVLQHVPFEGLGLIGEWGKTTNAKFHVHKLFENSHLPNPDQVDFLIILGGPMSATDTDYIWITKERELILSLINLDKPILGICLGGQQIAKALGSPIFQGEYREVGWLPIQSTTGKFDFFPDDMVVFHWHGEQFETPKHAEKLFKSEACENQGFIYNNNVVGLQFHFESTTDSVNELLEHDRAFIDGSKYTQSEDEIKNFQIPIANKQVLFSLLDYLIKRNL